MSYDPFSKISFYNDSNTASMDTLLGSDTSGLVDSVRARRANKVSYKDGDRVYAFTNNGMIIPSGLPRAGSKGTIVAVRTATGERTSLEGDVFVRWDDRNKIESVPAPFLRKASVKVSNLDDFVFLSGNSSMQIMAAQESQLVHKATKDLWSVKISEDGSFDVERLFDENGDPLKF